MSSFHDATGLLQQRLAAIRKVQTPWFFFLDDDDALPPNHLSLLTQCLSTPSPLVYTNETVNGVLRRSEPYSQEAHLKNALLVHHLAVCNTEAALRASARIPQGVYALEPLLYFQMAKEGATWIDQVGYHWHRKPTGLSHHPSLTRGLVRAILWAQANRD